ncbi:MAG: zinc ribbon domain-containing protein [Muribaculaceae bacterium]|nr:zinc ribbon domain-containing protein [Muribaculaceae bacterium]
MSYKRCVHCHRPIDDDFQYCPYCGHPLVLSFETADDATNSDTDNRLTDREERSDGRQGCGWTVGIIVFLLVVVMAGLGWYLYRLHQQEVDESIAHKIRLDSIEAAHREMVRLDSLRRDSIERANFCSPDLAIFGLRGHVNSVIYSGEHICCHTRFFAGKMAFDANGNLLINSDLDFGGKCVVSRDADGRVSSLKSADNGMNLRLKWDGAKLVEAEWEDEWSKGREVYTYNGDNQTKITIVTIDGDGRDMTQIVLRYAEYDRIGNWISCQWSGRQVVETDSVEASQRVNQIDGTIRRTITYH